MDFTLFLCRFAILNEAKDWGCEWSRPRVRRPDPSPLAQDDRVRPAQGSSWALSVW